MSPPRRAKLLLFLVTALPIAWTVACHHHPSLSVEMTSSFQGWLWCSRQPWLAFLWGWMGCDVCRAAWPEMAWWERALFLVAAAGVGHVLFPQDVRWLEAVR